MLIPDEVKKLIAHSDSEVRNRAVEYFHGTPEDDGTIFRAMLDAIEALKIPFHNWPMHWDALRFPTEQLPRLLRCVGDSTAEKRNILRLHRLRAKLSILPLADWDAVRPTLEQAGMLNDTVTQRIERRREFAALDEDGLYERMHDYADEHHAYDAGAVDMTYFEDVAEAFANLEIINERELLDELLLAGEYASWAELPLLDIVGLRRVKAGLPVLIDLLGREGDFSSEHAMSSLAAMSEPSCAGEILSRCHSGFLYPMRSGYTLGRIHSPLVEQQIVAYLNTTTAKESPFLVLALGQMFSREAIPRILELLDTGRIDRFLQGDLEMDLRMLSIALDVPLPGDLRRRLDLDHAAFEANLERINDGEFGSALKEQDFAENQKPPDSAPAPNTPCPCGSGKKFKKCCMYK